jgi:hypothetical protein
MRRFVVVVAVLSFLAGCRRAPELIPRLIFQGDGVGDDFWLAAPYVVVVNIVNADLQGPRQPIYRGGPKDLQLVKFVANVENVIKGELPDKKIDFYFFAAPGWTADYYLHPGRRYIVSLRREGAVLRSWADATQLRIEVRSGSHDQKDLPLAPPPREPITNIPEPLPPDRGLQETIAYLLFTPGQGCDLNEFARTLGMNPDRYGHPRYVIQLLKRLLQHPDRQIRETACFQLWDRFGYRPDCLEQCLKSPDSLTRQVAERRLKEEDDLPQRLLRSNGAVSILFTGPEIDYIIERLGLYAEDMRPEVRKGACESLRRFAPQRAGEYCKDSR